MDEPKSLDSLFKEKIQTVEKALALARGLF